MTQAQTTSVEPSSTELASNDSLAGIRLAAQDLHSAISDAATKRGKAIREHLQTIAPTAGVLIASVKAVIGTQTETAKKHLIEAIENLEATETQIAASMKSSGQVFQTAVRQALVDSRSAVQKITEVVAAARSARAQQQNKA